MKPRIIIPALAALLLSACGESKKATDNGAPAPDDDSAFSALLLDAAPDGAMSITEARKKPEPGTEVVISGKVMGKMEPFVNGRALLTLGDPTTITSCDLMPGDDCPTPWDVCCDDPDVIKASIATVQVLDAEGRPLKSGLKGLGGMKELSSLVVKGTVAKGSNSDNLLINASGIHIAMVEATKENPASPQP